MPRRVQDIIPGDRRSIRDVEPHDIKKTHSLGPGRKVSLRRLPLTPPPPKKDSPRSGRLVAATIVIVLVVAAAGWAASVYFSHATFVIAARTVAVSVDTTVVASGTSTPGYLPYELMSFNASASTTVAAADGPVVSTKAQGSVTIYNIYSTQTQRLVAGTRLANDSGLIYHLTGSVVVPGYTLSNGSIKPGSLVTTVVADQPGEDYNLSRSSAPSDFKIVAYQGSPKYDGFYARLASDITGGFDGQKKTVDPSTLASTTVNLRIELTTELLAEAKAAVPPDSIMYTGAYVTDFTPVSVGGDSPNSAIVSKQGILYAILFKRADLITKLAGANNVAVFGNFPYTAPGLEALSFTVSNARDFSPENKSILIVHWSGAMKLVGTVPIAEIKQQLSGLELSDTGKILQTYSPVIDIGKSSGELSPPWVSRVPTDLSRISVEIVDGT